MSTPNPSIPVNVVICTHGRCDLMHRTLKSLSEAERPAGFEQVWVIENGPESGTRLVCERMVDNMPLNYIHIHDAGKSRALQYALDMIGRGLVVFTDDDVRIDKHFINAYARAAAQHGPDVFYGGVVEIDYEKPPPDWLLPRLPPSATGWHLPDTSAPITKACFLGANYGAFAERLKSVGGYKAHLGVGSMGNPVGEEFEIQDRLLDDGCRGVYIPDAIVWHYVPRQRCTPRWTLQRHERIWFTSAMCGTKTYDGPRLAGVPRWMWKRLAKLWAKALIANLIPNPQRRFEAKLPYYQWRGTLRGLRRRHSQPAEKGTTHDG